MRSVLQVETGVGGVVELVDEVVLEALVEVVVCVIKQVQAEETLDAGYCDT